jgi:hypothetical protein
MVIYYKYNIRTGVEAMSEMTQTTWTTTCCCLTLTSDDVHNIKGASRGSRCGNCGEMFTNNISKRCIEMPALTTPVSPARPTTSQKKFYMEIQRLNPPTKKWEVFADACVPIDKITPKVVDLLNRARTTTRSIFDAENSLRWGNKCTPEVVHCINNVNMEDMDYCIGRGEEHVFPADIGFQPARKSQRMNKCHLRHVLREMGVDPAHYMGNLPCKWWVPRKKVGEVLHCAELYG